VEDHSSLVLEKGAACAGCGSPSLCVRHWQASRRFDTAKRGASAEEMISVIQNQTNAVAVQGTSACADGFYGWMLEAACDGTFETATSLLGRGIRIINSKATQ
jgi:hypothetical protein